MFLLLSLIIAFMGFVFVSLVYAESQYKINAALNKAKDDTDLTTDNQNCLVKQANLLIVGNMVSIAGEHTPYQLMRVYVGKDGYQWASVLDMNNVDCPNALTDVRTNLLNLEPQLNNWNEQYIKSPKQINA